MESNDPMAQLSEADWIIRAFPSEPEWETVSEATLIKLVEEYYMEPSCAGLALSEVIARRHPRSEELCNYLLHSGGTDKWLRAGALETLIALNPIDGLSKAMAFIEDDNCLLEDVIVALNYEHQGSLADAVHRHPIVPLVKRRIAQLGPHQVEFSDIFAANFGTD